MSTAFRPDGAAADPLALPDLDPDQPLVFEAAEYAARQRRLKEALAARGLDAVLLYSIHSLYYLYGYDLAAGAAIPYGVVLAPCDGEPTACVRNTLVPWLSRSTVLRDIQSYDEPFRDDNAAQTVALLAARGLLAGRRIGIETRSQQLNAHDYALVRARTEAGGGTLVDASDLVMELRIRKSPAEIAMMRQAGRLYDVFMAAALAAIRPGVRECDVHAQAVHAVYAAGGDDVAQPLMLMPIALSRMHCLPPSRRRLRAGDGLFVEAAGCYNRYHVVGGRTVVCGALPGAELRAAQARARESIELTRSLLRPGATADAIARTVMAARQVREHEAFYAAYGTGIGFRSLWHEDLILRAGDPHVLEPGMTLTVFGFGTEGESFAIAADPVVITERGCDSLSALATGELQVAGA
jgi:Xaa-Pro aminopeptidase